MSLILTMGSKPNRLVVKTRSGSDSTVHLGKYQISLVDFLVMAEYVLTNTELNLNDPRIQFLKIVRSMKQTDGYMPGRKRLEASKPAFLPQP